MLFLVSPVSITSLRLMVMVFVRGGGSAFLGDFQVGGAVPVADAGDDGMASVGSVRLPSGERDASEAAGLLGSGCSGPISGGSPTSESTSGDGRETIIVSPASLEIPPASARTSSSVTGRSAWYTIGCMTAPTTVMGLLLCSLTLTRTSACVTKPLASR